MRSNNSTFIDEPHIMAHRGGDCFGVENSATAIRASLQHGVDIIEVDVCKSSDGILFCYHGNWLQYVIPFFFFKKKYSKLKKRRPKLIILKHAIRLVGDKAILFLDIKDTSISPSELHDALAGIKVSEVWVASRDIELLRKIYINSVFRRRIYNMGLLNPRRRVSQLRDAGVSVVELFSWNFSKKIRALFSEHGIDIALSRIFIRQSKYIKICFSQKSLWVCANNLRVVLFRRIHIS